MGSTAYLGLGSNLGDRLANLQRAEQRLEAQPGVRVIASSRVWETAPVGGPPQPDYLNAVLRIETDVEPGALLAVCHDVETDLGRTREVRWGPRTLDVDILLIDALTLDDADLTVPHPRLIERSFVVLPLLELDPEVTLPDGSRVADVAVMTGDVAPFAPPLQVSA